jgi:hypothetical protein
LCVVKKNSEHKEKDDPEEEKAKYVFKNVFDSKSGKKLKEEFEANFIQLKEYVKTDIEMRKKKWENRHKSKLVVHQECTYQGRFREELGEDKETTFTCDCLKNGFGQRCEYNLELYNAFNAYLEKLLKKVSFKQ